MDKVSPATRKTALAVTTLGSFLTSFMGSSINVALPIIGKEFAIDAIVLSWIATSYLLAAAMFLVPFGRIADIYGRKKIFTYGVILYTFSSFLTAIAQSALILILFRVLQGISGAMIFSTGAAMLISVFPPQQRGRVLGINVSAVYIGLSTGPFLGGILTQHLGWRSIFAISVIVGVAIVLLIYSKLEGEWVEADGETFDFTGSLIYAIALTMVMFGFSSLPSVFGTIMIIGGIAFIFLFIKWELHTRHPVLDMNLFKNNTVFTFSNLAALINYSATFAVTFIVSLYLQYIKGISPQSAGIILISQPVTMALFSPIAGRMSDKIQPQVIASWGMAFTTIGLLLLTFLHLHTSILFIITCLIFIGFGIALFSSPNTNAVMSSVHKKYYGVASGILGTMRLTGQAFSMGIVTLILAVHMGRVQITPLYFDRFLQSSQTAFIIFTLLCFGGIFASLARGKIHR
ncbi:MAG TPA: MFS transporter [Spirochaetota bacterium]|nr:MFS transporter [Spirochaetota bacterium]HOM08617.1 MFS transporter [Spirochaetota bacterium]HPP48436.1 MFS transporter [Spirochaetota bacterium]HXK65021.1 MFS transporter [Spirochaetota bacterium]